MEVYFEYTLSSSGMRQLFLTLFRFGGLVLLGVVLFEVIQFSLRVRAGKVVAASSAPFQQVQPGASTRILVAGDSTAAGTGAAHPGESVAGRFGAAYPDAEIINIGKNGARTRDLLQSLRERGDERFSLVLLQIGGNDILRWTNLRALDRDIRTVLTEAHRLGDRVVLFTAGNVGLAPMFPRPLGWFYSYRTLQVREIFRSAAAASGALYVDAFTDRAHDLFLTDPPRYYAPDYLHLSGEGYRSWYEAIARALAENGVRLD